MPRLPGEIAHGIEHSNPEERWHGEEGLLHRIGLDDERYFAKRWRGKHYERARTGLSVTYSEESGRTPVSPFWHKVKFWESHLMHDAFPDEVLRVPVAYDPRISHDGEVFIHGAGLPVTVTKDVEGDPALRDERDRIVREAYDRVFASRSADERGVVGYHDTKERATFWYADEAMAKRFGVEFLPIIASHDRGDGAKLIELNLRNARANGIGSSMIALLEAGIIPIHPGVNFLPTAESDPERGPRGVYLEVLIADVDRLRAKLKNGCATDACRKRTDEHIERFLMYRLLDDLYDDLFADQYWFAAESDVPMLDPDVIQRGFEVLRTAQERLERDGVAASASWVAALRPHTRRFPFCADRDAAFAELDAIRAIVDNGGEIAKAA